LNSQFLLEAGPGAYAGRLIKSSESEVPDIEECFLPGPAGLQSGELIEHAPLAGRKDARPALHDWFGRQKFTVFDRVDAKVEEVGEGLNYRRETNKPLHKRNKRGEVENGVARKVVGLKLVKIEKVPEEVRHWES
jgi:hypothetical protein